MKPKLVKFKNGTYAIRRWSLVWLQYEYKDLKQDYWWPKRSRFFNDCVGTEERCRDRMKNLEPEFSDFGTPVD